MPLEKKSTTRLINKIESYLLKNGEIFRNGYLVFISQADLAKKLGVFPADIDLAVSKSDDICLLAKGCYYIENRINFEVGEAV